MKKISVLFVAFLLSIALPAFAQEEQTKPDREQSVKQFPKDTTLQVLPASLEQLKARSVGLDREVESYFAEAAAGSDPVTIVLVATNGTTLKQATQTASAKGLELLTKSDFAGLCASGIYFIGSVVCPEISPDGEFQGHYLCNYYENGVLKGGISPTSEGDFKSPFTRFAFKQRK